MAAGALILWGHALAALLFGGLAIGHVRDRAAGLPWRSFVTALALTALWALAVAGIDAHAVVTPIMESARNIAWFAFLIALLRGSSGRVGGAVGALFATVILICAASAGIAIAAAALPGGAIGPSRTILRMIAAVTGLVLVQHLAIAAAPARRGGVRLALAAVAAMWVGDLILYTAAWLSGGAPAGLVAARGLLMAGVAALLAVAAHRGGDWTLKLSRTVASRSLWLLAIGLYGAALALVIGPLGEVGGRNARLFQTAFVTGATATLIAVLASPWLRAWVKVKLAKHLFDHRYDYRHEWLRFTGTLGSPAAGPLEERVVMAVANLTDSPAGLLLVADGEGLTVETGWNWSGETGPVGPALAQALRSDDRIADLDAARRSGAAAALPDWLAAHEAAWTIVPLVHLGQLTGAVVLSRPPVARALDWEDFDLLRVAGRQGASYLAEHRAAAALSEAQRFDEFNRRFAFIIHDVKNLVSQLTLVARNAERHADNPAFRADMVATLKDSSTRMTALLQRLSQHSGQRADPPRPADITAIVRLLARQRRGQHPLTVTGEPAIALVDPVRFEQVLTHLIQNAIEASPAGAPVAIAVVPVGGRVIVTVADTGPGMTPAFVRDELFRPFASSKHGGFGIGAFEARQLAQAMGGTIAVDSVLGRGTRFAVGFPAAPALETAA